MAVTEPGNLANIGWNGDVPETAVTNEAASQKGFPARTQGGDLVFIVKQQRDGLVKLMTDSDGNVYVDDQVLGHLVPFSAERIIVNTPGSVEITEQDVEDAAAIIEGETLGDSSDDLVDAT